MSESRLTIAGSALVTGASRGIGRVIALRLAAEGIPVAVNFRSARAEADDVVRCIQDGGGRAVALQADLSSSDAAGNLFASAERALGPVGLLVNNAGATRDRLVLQMSEDDWDFCWTTNLAGTRALGRRAIEAMSARTSGRVINVSSVVGHVGNGGQANYAAAKSAVLGVTRELALAAAPSGVTVNCVMPGYIVTDATAHLTDAQQDQWMRRIPMRRYAVPEEVADVVLFLAGRGAAYITGQCIAVDGGFLAKEGAGLAS